MDEAGGRTASLPTRLRAGRLDAVLPFLAILAAIASTGAFLAVRNNEPPAGPGASPAPTVSATPTASPAPSPATEEPGETEKAAEPSRPGRRLDLSDLTAQVVEIRGLDAGERFRSRLVSAGMLADKVSEIGFSEIDPDEIEADRRLLVALRLAPDDLDLLGLLEELYREQILGLYVPGEKTLYVRGDDPDLTPGARLTAAHEVVHALQDLAFDLDRMQKRTKDDSDAALALLSLIEGDAVVAQQQWSLRHLDDQQRQEAFTESQVGGDTASRAPDYLRSSLFFPYTEGLKFVSALYAEGGFARVDEAFSDPPTTTEQILHPDRYLAGETSTNVTVGTDPGAGWEESADYVFGEFDLAELLDPLGDAAAATAAEGWDGGHVVSWTRGRRTAVALSLAFDTESDAQEACAAVPEWFGAVADATDVGRRTLRGDADHLAYTCQGRTVAVGIAPDAGTARRLAADD